MIKFIDFSEIIKISLLNKIEFHKYTCVVYVNRLLRMVKSSSNVWQGRVIIL